MSRCFNRDNKENESPNIQASDNFPYTFELVDLSSEEESQDGDRETPEQMVVHINRQWIQGIDTPHSPNNRRAQVNVVQAQEDNDQNPRETEEQSTSDSSDGDPPSWAEDLVNALRILNSPPSPIIVTPPAENDPHYPEWQRRQAEIRRMQAEFFRLEHEMAMADLNTVRLDLDGDGNFVPYEVLPHASTLPVRPMPVFNQQQTEPLDLRTTNSPIDPQEPIPLPWNSNDIIESVNLDTINRDEELTREWDMNQRNSNIQNVSNTVEITLSDDEPEIIELTSRRSVNSMPEIFPSIRMNMTPERPEIDLFRAESPDVVEPTWPVRRFFRIPAREAYMHYFQSSDSSEGEESNLEEEESNHSSRDSWSLSSSSMEFEDLASDFSEDSFFGQLPIYTSSDEE